MTTQSSTTESKKKYTPDNGVSSANLPQFQFLEKEIKTMTMPERKRLALLNKLVSLYYDKKEDARELKLLREILEQDLFKGTISSANLYLLNSMDNNDCDQICTVKTDNAPAVLNLKKSTICKYKFDPKLGSDRAGRYVIFVPVTVEGKNQLTLDQALRQSRGLELALEEVPKDKVIYKRVTATQREFNNWFSFDDEVALNSTPKEDYTF